MKVVSVNIYGGKNIFSFKSTAKIIVDLEEYANVATKNIKGFNDKLLSEFPNLKKHKCSLGYEGGFLERLNEGTYLAHVTEHLIIQMQNDLGIDVGYGKAREIKDNIYYIVYEHKCEQAAESIGRFAVDIVNSFINNTCIDIEQGMKSIKDAIDEYSMGPSTKAICDVAAAKGIPILRIGNRSFMQLGYGKNQRRIQATVSDDISCLNADLASDKYATKTLLSDVRIPVPAGEEVFDINKGKLVAEKMGYPLVVKPLLGNQGKGVTANIKNEKELIEAFDQAKKIDKWIIIEKYHMGNDYRLLVVGDKVCAAAKREPASVIGDGVHNLKELIEIENTNPLRGNDHEKVLTKIKIDEIMIKYLSKSNLSLQYVPDKGHKIYLRPNCNLSTGGKAIDCTDEVCEENRQVAVQAAKSLGIGIAGIDIVAEDISKPLRGQGGVVLEVNAAPGIRMHLYPSVGHARNVAEDIVDYLFPNGYEHIPLISITGTNGKTTTARMLNEIFTQMNKVVGMTSTSGIFIGNKCIAEGDNTGYRSANVILSNKDVEVAVLETARGGIIKRGLGYDLADVAVITNITEDHLGSNNINTLEELTFVKSLVAEAVKLDGYCVLNADDPMMAKVSERVKSNIIYFSMNIENPIIKTHIQKSGIAVCLVENYITIIKNNVICKLIKVNDIAATNNGKIDCNIQNAMAACSASIAANVPVDIIRKGLKSFKSNAISNPGRFNIFKINNFHVMLDYGHNLDGYRNVIKFIDKIKCNRKVGIIGMPGDRRNEDIEAVANLCADFFDKIYIKEDNDLRGRNQREVINIIQKKITQIDKDKEIVVEESEYEALKLAVENAKEGDFIVIFFEDFKKVYSYINSISEQSKNSKFNEVI